jgi:hypothetical protein
MAPQSSDSPDYIRWLIDRVTDIRIRSNCGDPLFGTYHYLQLPLLLPLWENPAVICIGVYA